jgi:hypothetical protein
MTIGNSPTILDFVVPRDTNLYMQEERFPWGLPHLGGEGIAMTMVRGLRSYPVF